MENYKVRVFDADNDPIDDMEMTTAQDGIDEAVNDLFASYVDWQEIETPELLEVPNFPDRLEISSNGYRLGVFIGWGAE